MRVLLMAVLAVFMTGCATLSDVDTRKLAVQYTTLKLIEQSSDFSAPGVIDGVGKIRGLVEADNEISLEYLFRQIRQQVDFSSLQPSDQLLVTALFSQLEAELPDLPDSPESRYVRILTFLEWVESAARLS